MEFGDLVYIASNIATADKSTLVLIEKLVDLTLRLVTTVLLFMLPLHLTLSYLGKWSLVPMDLHKWPTFLAFPISSETRVGQFLTYF